MQSWLPLVITLLIQAMASMALLALPVMAPPLARDLGVSPALAGPYIAVAYGGALAAALVSGNLVLRWGAIRMSQWGLLICALGLLLCAVPWLPAVALGAALIGVGYGPITPASSHLLARTTQPRHLSLVFSVKQTGVPLGGALAGLAVPVLLIWLNWQQSLVVVAAACVLSAWAAQPLRAALDIELVAAPAVRLGNLAQPIRLVLAHPALATMASCSFLFSMVQLSLGSYLVTYLHEDLRYDLIAAGLALSLTQLGGMAGRITWGYVADRWLGASRMLAVLAAVMALCALATAWLTPASPIGYVWALLIVFGASAIGWNGVYLAEVARQAPAGKASLATSGTLAFTYLGVVLGAPVFGALSQFFGAYRAGFLALMVASAVCGALLVFNQRRAPAELA